MANKLFNGSRFRFVGELTYKKDVVISDSVIKEGSKYHRKRASIGVRDIDNNVGYLEMSYIYEPKNPNVKIFGEKQIDIPIKDLLNPKYENVVPSYQKIILNFIEDVDQKKECLKNVYAIRELEKKEEQTEEVKEKIKEHRENLSKFEDYFEVIHVDSAMEILNSYLPKLERKKVVVEGRVNVNYYNGKSRLEYVPSRIEIARPEEKSELTIDAKLFFMDGCVNDDEENKRATIVAYLGQRYKKADKIFPVSLILDYSKLDLENSLHAQMLDFLMKSFEVEDEENVMNMRFQLKVINSREEKEFDENCLTDQQKTMIALGMATIDDFKPRGNVFGDRIQEIRVIKPLLIDDYANGALIGFPLENLANYIVNEKDDESDIKQEDVKKEETDPVNQDLFGGLFG